MLRLDNCIHTTRPLLKNVSFNFKKSDILRRNFLADEKYVEYADRKLKEWLCEIISQFHSCDSLETKR